MQYFYMIIIFISRLYMTIQKLKFKVEHSEKNPFEEIKFFFSLKCLHVIRWT